VSLIVGLTGPNAAGKGEAARWLAERGYVVHSLSDIVRERARALGRDLGRASLIETGQEMRREGGPGVLARLLVPRLLDRSVVDSIRHPAEVEELRRLPGFRLLGVDAPAEIRWRRAVARGREGDLPDFDTFAARERLENGTSPEQQQLSRALALADRVVANAGSLEQFRGAVLAVLADWEAASAEPAGDR
jgi:dephospho-CoA kinase